MRFNRTATPACEFLLRRSDATDFIAKVALGRLALRHHGAIDAVLGLKPRWNELVAARRYIPRHDIDQYLDGAKPLIACVPEAIWPLLSADQSTGWKALVDAISDP